MKTYYGNYLGMVINNADPEHRGRIQVFIPHIMPALYDGWNKEGIDIQISCVGTNIPEGLSPEIHTKLMEILPWAEAASPIIGTSAPGTFASVYRGGGSTSQSGNGVYLQGPTGSPIAVEGGDARNLINEASSITGLAFDGQKWGKCARGTTGLDKAANLIDNKGPEAGFEAASDLAAGGSNKTGYNPYTTGTGAKYFDPPFTLNTSSIKTTASGKVYVEGAQVGDSVFCGGGGGEENGHAQKLVGIDKNGDQIWVSDNIQNSGFFTKNLTASYNNFTVYRLNKDGLAKYTQALGGKITGQEPPTTTTNEYAADSRPASNNELATPTKQEGNAPEPQTLTASASAGMTGTISGGGTTSATSSETSMSPAFKAQYDRVYAALEGTKFANTPKENIPTDGEKFGVPNGTREEWAHLFTRMALVESSFNPSTKSGPSYGVYQLGQTAWSNYGNNGDVFNADDNTKAFTKYAESMYFGEGAFARYGGTNQISFKSNSLPGGYGGIAAGFGPLQRSVDENFISSRESLVLGKNKSEAEKENPVVTLSDTNTTHNTDGNGRTPIVNTNDMASGLFSYPNAGAMVWVFFREGNPLYPVYFAASYSSAEWQSAYRNSSDGALMAFGDPTKAVNSTIHKPSPAGGYITKHKLDLNDPNNNESVFTLFHQHGSNVTFKDGCDFYYSRNNRRAETEGDLFDIVRGWKEQVINGDNNSHTKGNTFAYVGKIDEESIKAMEELSNQSFKWNKMLMQNSKQT